MAQDKIEGNLIVKGNIYFIGDHAAASDTCNFDPLNPKSLLKSGGATKPVTVKNYIGGEFRGQAGTSSSSYGNTGYHPETWGFVRLNNVYCTGSILSNKPQRWFAKSLNADTRPPSHGTINGNMITPPTPEATYPN